MGGYSATKFALEAMSSSLRAAAKGKAEVDLTAGGRAIVALSRVSRPASRRLLERIAPAVGVQKRS